MSVYSYTRMVPIQEISLALIRVEGEPHKPCGPTHGRKAHVHRDPLGIFDMTDVHKRGNQTARNTAPAGQVSMTPLVILAARPLIGIV
jgi:hypothetical protein